jgi:hypothetical protein
MSKLKPTTQRSVSLYCDPFLISDDDLKLGALTGAMQKQNQPIYASITQLPDGNNLIHCYINRKE